jgi:4-aminobutyrate aminotransferase/(S)-3-amino-2-methylpropionate transaminase
MKTAFPGPKTKASIEKFGERMDNRAIAFPSDLSKSKGNYVVDPDGNQYLDMFTNISTIAVGY